jgi:hypothetical protein
VSSGWLSCADLEALVVARAELVSDLRAEVAEVRARLSKNFALR